MSRLPTATMAVCACLAATHTASAQTAVERGMKVYADQIRKWIVSPADMTKAAKAERKPTMKSFATRSKEDLDALVAYMLSLKAR